MAAAVVATVFIILFLEKEFFNQECNCNSQ
jgi:hypothetical protein